jgi:Outer membrane protein beta-barrel domain
MVEHILRLWPPTLENSLRKLTLATVLSLLVLVNRPAHSQQFDAAFGFGTVTSPSGTTDSTGTFFPSNTGGLYPSFSADLLLKHHLGVQGEVAWRASQGLYGGYQPYRPILYDFNAIYAPQLGKKAAAELMAGVGGEDLRFYTGTYTCNFVSCTNYVSSNHFAGHFGAGLRYYVWGNLFVRPEAHLYLINNNNEFSSGRVTRFGVSIGYSFKPGF